LASILGFIFGYGISKIFQLSAKRRWLSEHSVMISILALWLTCLGGMTRLGMDEIIGCIFIGIGVAWDGWIVSELEGTHVIDWFDVLLNAIYFFAVGSLCDFSRFYQFGYAKLIGITLVVAFIKRMPIVLGLQKITPSIETGMDAFMTAWLAPVKTINSGWRWCHALHHGQH
jgi:NhaP-type Na+/H+ or K+/H+ antiporter